MKTSVREACSTPRYSGTGDAEDCIATDGSFPRVDAGTLVLLAAAGFGAGAVNAVAGGGSLVSFPALLAAGYPSVTANVTNSVAVLPGYLGGSLAYRPELAGQAGRIRALAPATIAGTAAGAALLLVGPASVFEAI